MKSVLVENRVFPPPEALELPSQPGPKQREEQVGLRAHRVLQLRELGAQRPHGTTVAQDERSVPDQNVDERTDALDRLRLALTEGGAFTRPAANALPLRQNDRTAGAVLAALAALAASSVPLAPSRV